MGHGRASDNSSDVLGTTNWEVEFRAIVPMGRTGKAVHFRTPLKDLRPRLGSRISLRERNSTQIAIDFWLLLALYRVGTAWSDALFPLLMYERDQCYLAMTMSIMCQICSSLH